MEKWVEKKYFPGQRESSPQTSPNLTFSQEKGGVLCMAVCLTCFGRSGQAVIGVQPVGDVCSALHQAHPGSVPAVAGSCQSDSTIVKWARKFSLHVASLSWPGPEGGWALPRAVHCGRVCHRKHFGRMTDESCEKRVN